MGTTKFWKIKKKQLCTPLYLSYLFFDGQNFHNQTRFDDFDILVDKPHLICEKILL